MPRDRRGDNTTPLKESDIEEDYLENNPGTINNIIISYVGVYFSDEVLGQATLSDEDIA